MNKEIISAGGKRGGTARAVAAVQGSEGNELRGEGQGTEATHLDRAWDERVKRPGLFVLGHGALSDGRPGFCYVTLGEAAGHVLSALRLVSSQPDFAFASMVRSGALRAADGVGVSGDVTSREDRLRGPVRLVVMPSGNGAHGRSAAMYPQMIRQQSPLNVAIPR